MHYVAPGQCDFVPGHGGLAVISQSVVASGHVQDTPLHPAFSLDPSIRSPANIPHMGIRSYSSKGFSYAQFSRLIRKYQKTAYR